MNTTCRVDQSSIACCGVARFLRKRDRKGRQVEERGNHGAVAYESSMSISPRGRERNQRSRSISIVG